MQINNNGELLISINGKTKLLSKEEIVKLYNQGIAIASESNTVTNTKDKNYSEFFINKYFIGYDPYFVTHTRKNFTDYKEEVILPGLSKDKCYVSLGFSKDYPYFVSHTAESYPNSETSGDTVVDEIREKFLERSKVGQAKYGTNLDRKDLSTIEWLNHAIEEQMDSILYLTKLKRELL
jgi:hypothetical protein